MLGPNPLSLSNNKNYRKVIIKTKKSYNRRKVAVKPTVNQKSTVSKLRCRHDFKIIDHKYRFSILKIIVFLEDLISQTTKQPLSNFDPTKT